MVPQLRLLGIVCLAFTISGLSGCLRRGVKGGETIYRTGSDRHRGWEPEADVLNNSAFAAPSAVVQRPAKLLKEENIPTWRQWFKIGSRTQGKIPVRRVCSDSFRSLHGNPVRELEDHSLFMRLVPLNGKAPTDVTDFPSGLIQSLVETEHLPVKLHEAEDGRYHLLLCRKKADCQLPPAMKSAAEFEKLYRRYEKELQDEYNQQSRAGFRGYSGAFSANSEAFKQVRDQLLLSVPGLVGVAPYIQLARGEVIFPQTSLLPKSHSLLLMSQFEPSANVELAPHMLLAYAVEHQAGQDRFRLPAPGVDGCGDTTAVAVLDLRNEGLRWTGPLDGVYIDLDNDGYEERRSWLKASSAAFLVWDRNFNNELDGISELLVRDSRSLATLLPLEWDTNGNGVLDAADPHYAQLKIWVDANSDGRSQKEELTLLAAKGIAGLHLSLAARYEEDNYGNRAEAVGSFLLHNGTRAPLYWVVPRPL